MKATGRIIWQMDAVASFQQMATSMRASFSMLKFMATVNTLEVMVTSIVESGGTVRIMAMAESVGLVDPSMTATSLME